MEGGGASGSKGGQDMVSVQLAPPTVQLSGGAPPQQASTCAC
jgi:hypothetical protein